MKKWNWGRYLWVISLFLLLIVILLMVMDYKIYYQYQEKNYLYFYECEGNLCTMEVEEDQKLLYSKYDCGDSTCPVFKSTLSDDYVILEDQKRNKNILFHYRLGK